MRYRRVTKWVDQHYRTACFCALAIVIACAWPTVILNEVAGPALGQGPGIIATCGYELLLMIVLGFVGARGGSWHITIVSVLAIAPATVIGDTIYRLALGSGSGFMRLDDGCTLLGRSILQVIAAGSSHRFFAWVLRTPEPGHCVNCDYDLTGNVSNRCPECGMPTDALIR